MQEKELPSHVGEVLYLYFTLDKDFEYLDAKFLYKLLILAQRSNLVILNEY